MTTTTAPPRVSAPHYRRHDELAHRQHLGAADSWTVEQVMALLPSHPAWPGTVAAGNVRVRGVRVVLAWLGGHRGQGWQERWRDADGDAGIDWVEGFTAADARTLSTRRSEVTSGLRSLILSGVILPGYAYFSACKSARLFTELAGAADADVFGQLEKAAAALGFNSDQYIDGRTVLVKMMAHTGRDVRQFTADDIFEYRAAELLRFPRASAGCHVAWDLLRELGVLPAGSSLREQLRPGQKTPAQLVARHRIQCGPIRDVLVRYLCERQPSVDYSTLRALASALAGSFWADVERHHPGIDTLHLPIEVAEAWKARLRTVVSSDGQTRGRRSQFDIMGQVRSFYSDIQEWATEDPSWIQWAVPCPVRRGDTDGMSRKKLTATARIHQRIRERLPLLPDLVALLEAQHRDSAALLDTATTAAMDGVFEHNTIPHRRVRAASGVKGGPDNVIIANLSTNTSSNATRAEDEAFWAWAVVETLRHSGIRIEEMLELTQLGLVSYQLPGSGEVVPLLQIVPSKTNEERLLLVSPELASTLATIITRLRRRNGGSLPLVARYDDYEATTGPPLPHLFQRRHGPQVAVMSSGWVRDVLNRSLLRTGLADAAGQPIRYTPHDFRRMFATEAVGNGLPIHIAAKVLGHSNINTTQAYVAVFQDDLIRTYRHFLDQRRSLRPAAEYREPTAQEWQDFQQHFEMRKVSLGSCARPYSTPCVHEHACVRCPVLRVDPRQRDRLVEIIRNLHDRIGEARANGWRGEMQGLEVSLHAAKDKLVELDRSIERAAGRRGTDLGMPAGPRRTGA